MQERKGRVPSLGLHRLVGTQGTISVSVMMQLTIIACSSDSGPFAGWMIVFVRVLMMGAAASPRRSRRARWSILRGAGGRPRADSISQLLHPRSRIPWCRLSVRGGVLDRPSGKVYHCGRLSRREAPPADGSGIAAVRTVRPLGLGTALRSRLGQLGEIVPRGASSLPLLTLAAAAVILIDAAAMPEDILVVIACGAVSASAAVVVRIHALIDHFARVEERGL